jgi:hypothetical protein
VKSNGRADRQTITWADQTRTSVVTTVATMPSSLKVFTRSSKTIHREHGPQARTDTRPLADDCLVLKRQCLLLTTGRRRCYVLDEYRPPHRTAPSDGITLSGQGKCDLKITAAMASRPHPRHCDKQELCRRYQDMSISTSRRLHAPSVVTKSPVRTTNTMRTDGGEDLSSRTVLLCNPASK